MATPVIKNSYRTLTIPNTGTTSNSTWVDYEALFAILCPAALTGTTFQIQIEYDGTFRTITDVGGIAFTQAFTADAVIPIPIEIAKNTIGTKVRILAAEQGDERVFTLQFKDIGLAN